MTWFRIDDKLHDHPKVRKLRKDKLAALGLWTACGSWSADTLSDGFVPTEIVQRFDPTEQLAKRLLEVGLWVEDEHDGEDGYAFVSDDGLHSFSLSRTPIPEELRRRVYERDGYACRNCGATERLSLDHVFPFSLGGPDTFDNLQTLCICCNSSKGARV